MGWDNPPVPWREFERRLSWRQGDKRGKPSQGARGPGDGEGADGPGGGEGENENENEGEGRDDLAVRPVTRLPVAGQDPAGPGLLRWPGFRRLGLWRIESAAAGGDGEAGSVGGTALSFGVQLPGRRVHSR